MTVHEFTPWLRQGNTIYALMYAGWRKGVELQKNRFSASLYFAPECPPEEAEAITSLIAAAPELLEALGVAYRHLDPTALRVSHCKDIALIEAAIQKAMGEQP